MSTVPGNLEQIRTKVRRITGRLSENQLTNDDLDLYINDFYVYDFPAHIKTFNLRTILDPIFGADQALIPNQAIYVFDWNAYTNISPPFYVGGTQIRYFQDTESFFNYFPTNKIRQQLSTGTGIAGPYGGTVTNTPILQESIFISTIDTGGASLHCEANDAGVLQGDVLAGGTINYQTGVVAGLTWTVSADPASTGIIAAGETIWVQSTTYVSGKPQAVLFYDGALLFYPVPDIAYEFYCTVNAVPDELEAGDQPLVRDWWNLIAFGASLKIFQDTLDLESYEKVKVFFNEALRLVERRTIQQLSTQRVSTIYDGYNQSTNGYFGYPYS